MADDLAGLAVKMGRVADGVDRLPRTAGHAVGRVGKDAVLTLARDTFGADRKFSGARGSRKAKRIATARYSIFASHVEVYPSGDPFYIFMKGRGRHMIRPWKKKALKLPHGGGWGPADKGVRRAVLGGALAPRTNLLDPAVREIAREAPKAIDKALVQTITKALA